MKILIVLFLVCSCCLGAFAATMTTTTGKGYYTFNGQVIGYYAFPPGNYDIDNAVSYVDTNGTNPSINEQAFNAYTCNREGSC